jgi:hypothetical protein
VGVSAQYTTVAIGALAALLGYMQAVQASPPAGVENISVIFGTPTTADVITENVLMVGSWEKQGGDILTDYASDWFDLPAQSGRRIEPFTLHFSIMSWSGDIATNPLQRTANALAMFNSLIEQIMDDYPWAMLGASGAWAELAMDIPVAGPSSTGGWGVVLECSVKVINAIAQGYPSGN